MEGKLYHFFHSICELEIESFDYNQAMSYLNTCRPHQLQKLKSKRATFNKQQRKKTLNSFNITVTMLIMMKMIMITLNMIHNSILLVQ